MGGNGDDALGSHKRGHVSVLEHTRQYVHAYVLVHDCKLTWPGVAVGFDCGAALYALERGAVQCCMAVLDGQGV